MIHRPCTVSLASCNRLFSSSPIYIALYTTQISDSGVSVVTLALKCNAGVIGFWTEPEFRWRYHDSFGVPLLGCQNFSAIQTG